MDIICAKQIIRALADGVNPMTGEILPEDSIYNYPDIIRALFVVLEELSYKPNTLRDSKRNAGKPWTELEEDKLIDEFDSKIKISEIAREHGRTPGAIESRLVQLGLIPRRRFAWFKKRK